MRGSNSIIIRGGYKKRGKCILCGGDVVERLPTSPCGQQVNPVHYYCVSCKLTGSNHLWEDAWAAHTLRNAINEVNIALEEFRLAVWDSLPILVQVQLMRIVKKLRRL